MSHIPHDLATAKCLFEVITALEARYAPRVFRALPRPQALGAWTMITPRFTLMVWARGEAILVDITGVTRHQYFEKLKYPVATSSAAELAALVARVRATCEG